LVKDFYDPHTDTFDPTKVPDVYDCIKFDALHNSWFLEDLKPLYRGAKRVVCTEMGVVAQLT